MVLQNEITDIKKQIKSLQNKLEGLLQTNEDNLFSAFLKKSNLQILSKIEYKSNKTNDKVKCRIKTTTLYDKFLNYLKDNDEDIITKSNYNKILIRNNIQSIIHTGIKHLLLKKITNIDDIQEVMICGKCELEMPFDDYEYHINSSRCKQRQKILRLQEEMMESVSN